MSITAQINERCEAKLLEDANSFSSSYEKLISTTKYPLFYYELAVLKAIKGRGHLISYIYDESFKYPQVHQVLLSIKESINLPFEKIYPEALLEWINKSARLSLLIYRENSKENCQKFLEHLDEGGHYDHNVVKYYRLCIEAFRKIGHICSIFPTGSPTIQKAANLGADLNANGDMRSSQKLQKLLDMETYKISPLGVKILHLSEQKEDKTLEFKSSFGYDVDNGCRKKELKKECTKTIAAFLNSNGGNLIVGISDNGDVLGLDNDLSISNFDHDKFILSFKDAVKNALGVGVSNNVSWTLEEVGDNRKVLLVEVKRSSLPCWHHDNEFFVRNNASSDRVLSDEEYDKYAIDRFRNPGRFKGS